ncbi:MAG: ADP-ribosylation factor-like protein [Promethearchaeota archaeon]
MVEMSDISSANEPSSTIILSIFEKEGPIPKVCIPKIISDENQMIIAMKSISLLMGEQIYQGSSFFDSVKYFGILPFPDLELTGLTYFFLIKDENARGKAKAATISLLMENKRSYFLYENTKQLSLMLGETAKLLSDDIVSQEKLEEIMNLLSQKIENYVSEVISPVELVRKLKVLFVGLGNSGKTSYLRAIRQKFSELTEIRPTKGVERTEITVLGQELKEWDLGGQERYRASYIKNADLYLYDTNLLFYFIDIRDDKRFGESFEYFGKLIEILKSFKQYPPIIINFHKMDPDISKTEKLEQKLELLREKFKKLTDGFSIQFFQTSIFDAYSLNKSFSEGISSLSPNREIFAAQLEWFSSKISAQAMLLLNENSLILSDYAVDKKIETVSEISAPHFQNLFRTFTDFKLITRDQAIWHMEDSMIMFNHFKLENNSLYLLTLTRDKENAAKKFEKNFPKFKERIKLLIQTYL